MLSNALQFIVIVIEVVLLFNLLIIVHELGHFLAARWRGLVVEKFGIWFGKPLWKKKINGVEYSLGSIPAGGFVALPQMAPMEAIEGGSAHERGHLPPVSPLDKIIVAAAGPLFSFLLAIVFAVVVWAVGKPADESETTTVIGYVQEGGPAAAAGLLAGDRVLRVDGRVVSQFGGMSERSIVWNVIRSEGDAIAFEVERDGKTLTIDVKPGNSGKSSWWRREGLKQVQIGPKLTPVVAKVVPGSVAEEAGLAPNDRIVEAGGKPVYHVIQLSDMRGEEGDQLLPLGVVRGGRKIALQLAPMAPMVGSVMDQSPAANAGLETGDRILSANGQPVNSVSDLSDTVKANPGKPVAVEIRRHGNTRKLEITPQTAVYPDGTRETLIGVVWQQDILWDQWGTGGVVHPTPLKQIRDSVMTIVNTIGAIVSPKSDVKLQHLSGPVGIMRIYYLLFQSPEGWRLALWFSVILNVNLAMLNLLPLPVLDGGHITIALVEWIRRRPINIRLLEIVQTGCALVLIGYMLYVTFYDVGDLAGEGNVRFLPPPGQSESATPRQ